MRKFPMFAIRLFSCGRKAIVAAWTVLVGAGLALALAQPTTANTIVFGSVGDVSVCARNGPAADQDCETDHSVINGALDNAASANFVGQASADDKSFFTIGDASANLFARFDVPYTITRTVQVNPAPGGAIATFPIQQVIFDIGWGAYGATESDNNGDQRSESNEITLASQEALFSDFGIYGSLYCTGDCIFVDSPFSQQRDHTTTVNLSGSSAGEVSASIPSDYRTWEDFLAPFAADYSTPFSVTQSYTGNLSIEFNLSAESSSDALSNGGEAIACAGLGSTLSGFSLDDTVACGSGLWLDAHTIVVGTAIQAVPEPTTGFLLVVGLTGLAISGRRRRA